MTANSNPLEAKNRPCNNSHSGGRFDLLRDSRYLTLSCQPDIQQIKRLFSRGSGFAVNGLGNSSFTIDGSNGGVGIVGIAAVGLLVVDVGNGDV